MRLIFIMVFMLFYILAHADSLSFFKTIPVKASLFTTDPIGNMYVVKMNNNIVKYNAKGDSILVFNEIKKGKITHIDATNPLRVLAYSADYNYILILDNMLSLKSELRLSKLNIFNVPCIANSSDGYIWVYDPINFSLLKIDETPKVIQTSSLRGIIDNVINTSFMVEQNRELYVVDSTLGVYRFDRFGFYMNLFPQKGVKEVQVFSTDMVFKLNDKLKIEDIKSFREGEITIPDAETAIQTRVERNRMYVLYANQIVMYNILRTKE